MANKRYNEGAKFEREIRQYFEDKGFIAVRSAGSHGKFDIWATNGTQLWLVQAKKNGSKKYAEKVLAELVEIMRKKFPLIGMAMVLYVATDLQDKKLLGYAKRFLPAQETLAQMMESIKELAHDAERAKGTEGKRAKADSTGTDR